MMYSPDELVPELTCEEQDIRLSHWIKFFINKYIEKFKLGNPSNRYAVLKVYQEDDLLYVPLDKGYKAIIFTFALLVPHKDILIVDTVVMLFTGSGLKQVGEVFHYPQVQQSIRYEYDATIGNCLLELMKECINKFSILRISLIESMLINHLITNTYFKPCHISEQMTENSIDLVLTDVEDIEAIIQIYEDS